MELYLIRHAQSCNNALPERQRVEDPGLTEAGRQQADRLAEWIPHQQLTRLYTSPFRRALETTEPIRRTTGLTPEVRRALHELGGCYRGYMADNYEGRPGMTRSEIEEYFPGFRVETEIDGQGWWASQPRESEQLARQRAARLLQSLLDEFPHSDDRAGYVMHADIIMLLLEEMGFEASDCPCNASVTRLLLSDGVCRVLEYDTTQHLPLELITR